MSKAIFENIATVGIQYCIAQGWCIFKIIANEHF